MKHNVIDILKRFNINEISLDSRSIDKDSVFFAVKGEKYDGNSFIDEVLAKGAKAVFTDNPNLEKENVFYIPNLNAEIAKAARFIYKDKPEYLFSVTGTNGKTSVVSYCRQICNLLGKKAASIGTLGVEYNGICNEISLTTSDIITFRKNLSFLKRKDINYVAFESSSHGLAQDRISGISIMSAAFTNITHDHLDYHKTFDEYVASKLKLFNYLKNDGFVVLTKEALEIPRIRNFFAVSKYRQIVIGGNCVINELKQTLNGQYVKFTYDDKNYEFVTPIIAKFQVINVLISAFLVSSCFDLKNIVSVLSKLQSPKGRLERITPKSNEFHIFVDYAHTPDALEKVLRELNAIKQNRVIVVFGCGGDRDKEKRSLMGMIAANNADIVIVTDDNPRTEDPSEIRKQILSNIKEVIEIGCRHDAICYAIDLMEKGDILLISGKGHENYQIIGNKKMPSDDTEICIQHLKSKGLI